MRDLDGGRHQVIRPSDSLVAHREELITMLKKNDVVAAVVVGSTAAGTDTERSDLDIAVRFGEAPHGFAYYGAIVDLETKASRILNVRVDLIVRGAEEADGWTGPEVVLF